MLESLMHITINLINGPDVKDSDFASLIQDVVNKWSTEICWKKLAKVKQVDSCKLTFDATAANNASMHQPLDATTLLDDYEMQKNQFKNITPEDDDHLQDEIDLITAELNAAGDCDLDTDTDSDSDSN